MKKPSRASGQKLARFIQRWAVTWYVLTTILYAASIPMTIAFFPKNTLVLSIVVLFGGLTSSVAALASVIVVAEDQA